MGSFCLSGHPWIVDDRVAPDKPLDSAVLSRLKQFSAMNKLKKMALRVCLIIGSPFYIFLYLSHPKLFYHNLASIDEFIYHSIILHTYSINYLANKYITVGDN